ncbi:STAS domain-containing protein [Actinospica robiniae]|uniref:STAS domain-containing protein n=1 Tax=Actinospica robiniae TaxID=304901 RepID=UPI00041AA347|nr:STAS domain-containing protein [Actinospica robiniae]
MPTHLSLVSEHRGGTEMLLVSGEVDLSTAPRLQEAIARAAEPGRPLVLDLTGVEFLDSAGARVLAEGHQDLDRRRGRLLIVPSGAVRRVFDLGGLEQVLHVHATVDDANEAGRRFLASHRHDG